MKNVPDFWNFTDTTSRVAADYDHHHRLPQLLLLAEKIKRVAVVWALALEWFNLNLIRSHSIAHPV